MKGYRQSGRKLRAFTLVELLVAVVVLVILMAILMQVFNMTTMVTLSSNKHMDTDTQARTIFDRMAVDFGHMVFRRDIDYYVKQPQSSVPSGSQGSPDEYKDANLETGNDQIAFYSEVPGYYPTSSTSSTQSPLSLVAYRINADITSANYLMMERLGKGLVWNATSSADIPMVFYPIPIAVSYSNGTTTYQPSWPQAASATATDSDYELIGPEVFRFEYFYNLKKSSNSTLTNFLSNQPWDSTLTNHTSLNGWQDVASVTVLIAAIDSRSRPLLSQKEIQNLITIMDDSDKMSSTWKPGDLEAQWRSVIQNQITQEAIPAQIGASIRVYSRTFYLNTPSP